jgi:hypothetical protein
MDTQRSAAKIVYAGPMCFGHNGLLITFARRAWVSRMI